TDPRPVGKVIVTLTPEPADVQLDPSVVNFRAANGLLSSVNGVVHAVMTVPDGWKLGPAPVGLGDPTIGPVVLTTPLTTKVFSAVSAALAADGKTLVAAFSKADIDNNVPVGDAVPLMVSANFLDSN